MSLIACHPGVSRHAISAAGGRYRVQYEISHQPAAATPSQSRFAGRTVAGSDANSINVIAVGAVAGAWFSFRRRRLSFILKTRRMRASPEEIVAVDMEEVERILKTKRWLLLTAVSISTAMNAFLCMTFSSVEQLAAETLSISTMQVAGLYTIWLVTVLFGLAPGTYMTDRNEFVALTWSSVLNALSAAVRVVGAQRADIGFIILSQILCGLGAWPVFTLPGAVSNRHFPLRRQALATSIMLQANYFGWLVGVLVPPLWLASTTTLAGVFKKQMVVTVTCSAVAMALAIVAGCSQQGCPLPQEDDVAVISDNEAMGVAGFQQLFRVMYKSPRFAVQILSHGTLGGISFAAPSAIFFILDTYGFSSGAAAAANAAFIGCGTLLGVILGAVCKDSRRYTNTLRICYSVTAASLVVCAIMAGAGLLTSAGWWSVALLVTLCGASGAASLGFIGIAVVSGAQYPVSASLVSWAIESAVLGSAALLSFFAAGRYGFLILAITAALSKFVYSLTCRRRVFPLQDANGLPTGAALETSASWARAQRGTSS